MVVIRFTSFDIQELKTGKGIRVHNKVRKLISASVVRGVEDVVINENTGEFSLTVRGILDVPPAKDLWSDWSDVDPLAHIFALEDKDVGPVEQ